MKAIFFSLLTNLLQITVCVSCYVCNHISFQLSKGTILDTTNLKITAHFHEIKQGQPKIKKNNAKTLLHKKIGNKCLILGVFFWQS